MNTFNLQTLYFGGVAFKYINDIKTNFKEAARRAVDFMDVITTTGEETGKPPSIEKIKAMKEGAGDHPLAIASGMTAENVQEFMPYVKCFLVATGISKDFYNLDPSETRAFARAIGK
jgi:predicted TIM-barrel enzyme